jgi:exoribonuclease R
LPQEFDSTLQNEVIEDHEYDHVHVGDVMTQADDRQHRSILLERGLLPDFLPQARVELGGIKGPAIRTEESTRDLRHLVWCSIDNDDSRDLDQLTVVEVMPGGTAKIPVAIADVDAIVKKQSALDDGASAIKYCYAAIGSRLSSTMNKMLK